MSPGCCAKDFRSYTAVSAGAIGHLKFISDKVTWLDTIGA